MLYQLSYRPIDYLQESPNLVLLWVPSPKLTWSFGMFRALHDQSTCEGMTKAMSSEVFDAGLFRWEVAVVRSLP